MNHLPLIIEREYLNKVKNKSYDQIKTDAIKDHQKYFNRLSADFGSSPANILQLPTKDRLTLVEMLY